LLLTITFGGMTGWLMAVFWMAHPIHISITEVSYHAPTRAVQITIRLFVDDLETAVRRQTRQPELDLLNPPPGQRTDGLVAAYLKEKFSVALDGKKQTWNYIGHELEGPALIAYLEIEKAKKFSAIEVTNACLLDIFDDQNNLVHVNYRETVKSLRLTPAKQGGKLVF
jgi:hypothetical protein